MQRLLVTSLIVCGTAGCAGPADVREAEIVNAFSRADELLLRTRPTLVAGKYQRMASLPFEFYRGNLPLFRFDWELGRTSRSGFAANTQAVLGLADPHPENFGILVAGDSTAALEPNDFDSAGAFVFWRGRARLPGDAGLLGPVRDVVGEAAIHRPRLRPQVWQVPVERPLRTARRRCAFP